MSLSCDIVPKSYPQMLSTYFELLGAHNVGLPRVLSILIMTVAIPHFLIVGFETYFQSNNQRFWMNDLQYHIQFHAERGVTCRSLVQGTTPHKSLHYKNKRKNLYGHIKKQK